MENIARINAAIESLGCIVDTNNADEIREAIQLLSEYKKVVVDAEEDVALVA